MSQSKLDQTDPLFETAKRCLDILGALVGLMIAVPVLTICGIWIKLLDGGPVFYKQWRVGRDGWLFPIFKVRTMVMDAERDGEARFSRSGDPRILHGCGWMRKSHLDELPQFWNVLCGQMSLVGPRPERPEIIESLRTAIPRIDRRLAARPGITGFAQLRNGYTNDVAGARIKFAYDLKYLRKRSIWREFKLIVATLPRVWDHASL